MTVSRSVAVAATTLFALLLRASGIHRLLAVDEESQEKGKVSAFVSDAGLVCKEGPSRTAESALALAKAGVKGALFKSTFAHAGKTCADLGFAVPGGEDSCHPGVTSFFPDDAGQGAYRMAEELAMKGYAHTWNLSMAIVPVMAACTCHPESKELANGTKKCELLDEIVGAWTHSDPMTDEKIMCESGGFVYSTLALAVLKSTPLLAMHNTDVIAPVDCSFLGFPQRFHFPESCFPAMYRGLHKTPDPLKWEDGGVKNFTAIMDQLFAGGFPIWAKLKGKALDMPIFTSRAGCHCQSTSVVYHDLKDRCIAEAKAGFISPVREWWDGQVP